jgi:general secretion pathway protein J
MKTVARGFTLVEMLVALLAFSLLAAAAVGILNVSLRNKETLGRTADVLEQLQIARAMMKADFSQLAPRPVRDAYGGLPHGSFAKGSATDAQTIVSFVRRGWDNPGGEEARGSLQYVEYVVDGANLVRRSRPYLDPTPGTPTSSMTLLADVGKVSVSFLAGGKWLEQWRPVSRSAELPSAVAMTLTVAGLGEIRQAFPTSAH